MTSDLVLKGNLNLMGTLNLQGSKGGKVKIQVSDTEVLEVLVEAIAPSDPEHGISSPVVLPPPPATPTDLGEKVWIINSFNKSVTASDKPIVTQGMAIQGGKATQGNNPTWPGMVLPSQKNKGIKAVRVNSLLINVEKDQAIIFPSGGTAQVTNSGQS